jgi:putative spermidine/putrescine transport system ATP-binding protein
VMNRGAIEQMAEPATIYHRPATPFVLGFVGLSTRLSGSVAEAKGGRVVIATPYGPLCASGTLPVGTKAFIAVRPERIDVSHAAGKDNEVELPLRDVLFQGSKVQLHFDAGDDDLVIVEATQLPDLRIEPGVRLRLSFAAADAIAFPREAT